MRRWPWMPIVAAALACGAREPSSPVGPGGPAGGAGPPEPAAPAGACTVAEDLPAIAGAGACPATRPLGEPGALAFARHFTAPCADQIAVDGEGRALFRAVEALGGGGYWRSLLDAFGPDGLAAAAALPTSELLVPGAQGFLSYVAPTSVTWIDGAWSGHGAEVGWPVALPDAMYWPAYHAGLLALGAGAGGELLVALAGADARGDAEVNVARVTPVAPLAVQTFPALTIPAPAPDWTADRYAHALHAAAGTVELGADGAGRVLLLWDGTAACGAGTVAGRWFGPDGAPLGGPFLAARGRLAQEATVRPRGSSLFRLQDGSLVLRGPDGAFVRRFAGGAPAGGPPPAWLAARAGETLAPLPLPGAVAAIRGPAGGAGARVDVVAADGAVCRSHDLPAPAPAAGSVASGPATVAVGLDGSVVALDRVEPLAGTTDATCVYRVWRGALR